MPLVIIVFILGILVISFQYVWPLYALILGIAVALWGVKRAGMSVDYARERRADILKRADQQHALIMGGKEVLGTFGNYMPPEEFRYVGPTMPD